MQIEPAPGYLLQNTRPVRSVHSICRSAVSSEPTEPTILTGRSLDSHRASSRVV